MTRFKITQLIGKLFNNVKCKAKHCSDAMNAIKDNDHKRFLLVCNEAGIDTMSALCVMFDLWPELKAEAKTKAEAKAKAETEAKAEKEAEKATLLASAITELKAKVKTKRRGKFASAFEAEQTVVEEVEQIDAAVAEPAVQEVEEADADEAESVVSDEADAKAATTVIETVIAKPKALTTTIVIVGGLCAAISAGVAAAVITPVAAAALAPVCGVSAIGGVYSIVTS